MSRCAASASGRSRAGTVTLWLDAKAERVRGPGGVRHKALVVACGVHETGRREVVGIDVGEAETEAFWREFLCSLRARGLTGTQLCVSNAHEGLKAAIAKVLDCPWQRSSAYPSLSLSQASVDTRRSAWTWSKPVKKVHPFPVVSATG